VEGGQLAGGPDRGSGLVAGDRVGLGDHEPVETLAELVGEQRDRRQLLPVLVSPHAAGCTQQVWTKSVRPPAHRVHDQHLWVK
jgi:hypothetical protein